MFGGLCPFRKTTRRTPVFWIFAAQRVGQADFDVSVLVTFVQVLWFHNWRVPLYWYIVKAVLVTNVLMHQVKAVIVLGFKYSWFEGKLCRSHSAGNCSIFVGHLVSFYGPRPRFGALRSVDRNLKLLITSLLLLLLLLFKIRAYRGQGHFRAF
jgi:hypothetical protein